MKFIKAIRRDFRRLFRLAPSFNRLARRKAFRMIGQVRLVVGIHPSPSNGGYFLELMSPDPLAHKTFLWVDHTVVLEGGYIRVEYRPEPEEKLIAMYGRFGYRAEPTAYLAVAG